MDWFIAYDKDHYALIVYQLTSDIHRGETVIKISLDEIFNKLNELKIATK